MVQRQIIWNQNTYTRTHGHHKLWRPHALAALGFADTRAVFQKLGFPERTTLGTGRVASFPVLRWRPHVSFALILEWSFHRYWSPSEPLECARGPAATMPLQKTGDMPIGGQRRDTAHMLERGWCCPVRIKSERRCLGDQTCNTRWV